MHAAALRGSARGGAGVAACATGHVDVMKMARCAQRNIAAVALSRQTKIWRGGCTALRHLLRKISA